MKLIINIIKRIVLAFSVIYSLDLILQGYNVLIPINIQTLLVGTILGPLGIVCLIIIKLLI